MSKTRQLIDEIVHGHPSTTPMEWKIQTMSAGGWADLKSASDENPDVYVAEYYATPELAQEEIDSFFPKAGEPGGIDGDPSDFRVVPADTPAEFDLY